MIEKDFLLEFLTLNDNSSPDWNHMVAKAMGDDGCLVQERIFGPKNHARMILHAILRKRNDQRYSKPLVLIGNECLPVQYSGIVARPMNRKAELKRIKRGFKLTADNVNLLFSDPIHGPDISSESAFYSNFTKVSEVLAAGNMHETDIVRTWFFMKDIYEDYNLLNKYRNKYYDLWQLTSSGILPASTGIEGSSFLNTRLITEFWAFSGSNKERLKSPLQCEPVHYGVLFSRSLCITFPLNKLLFISGTASIDKEGRTVYLGDCPAQMEHILEVILALLHEHGGNYRNIVQSIIYIKKEDDRKRCLEVVKKADFPYHNSVVQIADMCRDDLLCEIEAHAIIS